MKTRFGELSTLELGDPKTQERIILAEKAALVQGMVVEALTDQIMKKMAATGAIEVMDNDLIVGSFSDPINDGRLKHVAFVDVTSTSDATWKLLKLLEQKFDVVPFIYDEQAREYLTANESFNHGNPLESLPAMTVPLQERVAGRTGKLPDHTPVSDSVQDEDEQKGVYWGELKRIYQHDPSRLERLIRSRLLKNSAFPGMSIVDVDRMFMYKDIPSCLEIQHKYPSRKGTFGMNVGQATVAESLAEAGLNYYHMILVNPVWVGGQSPAYLLFDLEKRKNVAVLGKRICKNEFSGSNARTAPKKTALTGNAKQRFYDMDVGSFAFIGMLDDSLGSLVHKVERWMNGEGIPATMCRLQKLKLG
ncbi:hypothetical protein [Alcanivorax sp.]|uniref:hypothetical protein n=1 Tax=Alcanivorax sp. TaxID=1872427 RepID=UPI0025896304|nr:hypothetical protein [Alcanivorax sp.]